MNASSGVIDENVHASEVCEHASQETLDVFTLSDIQLVDTSANTALSQILDHLLCVRRISGGDCDIRSRIGEPASKRSTDATGTSRHHGDTLSKSEGLLQIHIGHLSCFLKATIALMGDSSGFPSNLRAPTKCD